MARIDVNEAARRSRSPRHGQETTATTASPGRPPRLIGLVRVSTGKQEESGTGTRCPAQRHRAIPCERRRRPAPHLYRGRERGPTTTSTAGRNWDPAVADANLSATRLVIAQDRSDGPVNGRDGVSQITSGKQFIACDNPHANELTIDILVAVAADRPRKISVKDPGRRRPPTRPAGTVCQAVPGDVSGRGARGTSVGSDRRPPGCLATPCRNLTEAKPRSTGYRRSRGQGQEPGETRDAYNHLLPMMGQLRKDGRSNPEAIADRLNELDQRDGRRMRQWSRGQVRRVLARLKPA